MVIPRFAAAVLLASVVSAYAEPAAPVSGERYAHLSRGVNLTRWFQYGSHIPVDEAARDLLQRAGFTGVRIAVAPQYLLGNWAGPAEIEANLSRLDRGIDMFLRSGMSVTLDFQADAEYLDYYFATPGAAGELIETWRMLATRYASRNPELLFFEIMNEPDTRFTQSAWDRVQREALSVIHGIAPNHTVLLAPANWSGLEGLLQMTPYDDPNVIYVLHYYSPAAFTHQGATWTGQPGIAALRNVPWPAWMPIPEQSDAEAAARVATYQAEEWDRDHIAWDMHLAAEWAREWNARVIVNEFGAYKPFTDPESRMRWLHDVRTAIENQHLAWAVWDYAAGFDVTEMADGVRAIDPAVSAALGLTNWSAADPLKPNQPFTGPLTIQVGAGPEITGGAFDINAAYYPFILVTSAQENPVRLFLNDGHGVLRASSFEGPAPVVAGTPIVAGHFDRSGRPGYFFPAAVSKLALPAGNTLKEAPVPAVAATGAAAGDIDHDGVDDLVLFGPQLQLLRNDGAGHFHVMPNAFPPQAGSFQCGVLVNGNLTAFGQGIGRTFINKGRGRFREGKSLPASQGTGDCSAIADPDHNVIVAWTNDTVPAIGPLPPSKHGIRRIAESGLTLVITRPGEPPLIYIRNTDGTYTPSPMRPANNLSIAAPADLNQDGLTDLIYAQGGSAPLIGRFGQPQQ